MIYSDWHIHTDASYDAKLPLETLIQASREQGLRGFGIADHLNYNDEKFWGDIRKSSANFYRLKETCPEMRLGVELTPIAKPWFDYIARTGTRDGYVPPIQSEPYAIELAGTKEELMALGIQYAVGAALLSADGRVFTGCNIENASFGLTNCAERTAMFKAVSEGAREFTAIAIASKASAPYPCGACRQALNEFAPNLRILVTWGDGLVEETTLPKLLPHGFGPEDVNA